MGVVAFKGSKSLRTFGTSSWLQSSNVKAVQAVNDIQKATLYTKLVAYFVLLPN